MPAIFSDASARFDLIGVNPRKNRAVAGLRPWSAGRAGACSGRPPVWVRRPGSRSRSDRARPPMGVGGARVRPTAPGYMPARTRGRHGVKGKYEEATSRVTSPLKGTPDLRAPVGAKAARSGNSWSPGLSRSDVVPQAYGMDASRVMPLRARILECPLRPSSDSVRRPVVPRCPVAKAGVDWPGGTVRRPVVRGREAFRPPGRSDSRRCGRWR